MEKITSKINIGLAIRHELTEQEKSVSWLAREIGCDRSYLNKRLKKRCLCDEDLLLRISLALKVNFFCFYTKIYDTYSVVKTTST